MHSDIHYYGTYAMARASGLRPAACQTIATAAQFVDDNDHGEDIPLADGGKFELTPTAHPLFHIRNTELFDRDQRIVWLPFHFLPGGEGDGMSARLVCRKDSDIAREMVAQCLSLIEKPFGQHLVGIAAHVYADTFSHYGFSGVSSRWNKVDGDSITLLNDERDEDAEERFRSKYGETMDGLLNWRQSIFDKIMSVGAENFTGALGHGAVLKYPDYPYLEWKFSYEHPEGQPRKSQRNNLATFLEACKKLHEMFCRIGQDFPDTKADQGRGFDTIRDEVEAILKTRETNRVIRGEHWAAAAKEGRLFSEREEILPYQGDQWKADLMKLVDNGTSHDSLDQPGYRFSQAAATFRAYVLHDLLPAHGLIVV